MTLGGRALRAVMPLLAASSTILCCRLSDDGAVRLVRSYNERLVDAYRSGDARLVESVAGESEARKLTGLIGVKLDMGLSLDSRLRSFEVTGVERAGKEIRVRTREIWSYRDRRIGTGEQVGEASVDRYDMIYVVKREGDSFVVDEVRFATPPRVGRGAAPVAAADASIMHGVATSPGGGEGR